jgi:hypothetical protein
MRIQDRDALGLGHGRDRGARPRDDGVRVAALADAQGEQRRAFERLSYRDT